MMASLNLVKLTNRKLFKISGPDCYSYLQGLVCNDLRYLYEPSRIPKRLHARGSPNSLSTFMLNAQGRAICDMLIYRTPSTLAECKFTPPGQATEPDELLIECDSSLASGLANTLYGYRVRRKITISMLDNHAVWCLFPKYDRSKSSSNEVRAIGGDERGLVNLNLSNEILGEEFTLVNDPRLTNMGLRLISSRDNFDDIKKSLQSVINHDIEQASLKNYTLYRYTLGVGEGIKDHPESNCLPLECNADLLGSVSFEKGCYLGQELTARIHYTGVVRKRLMPIILDLESNNKEPGCLPLLPGTDIVDEVTNKKAGTLRHVVKNKGLALLRHEMVSGEATTNQLIHEGSKTKITTYVPFWWSQT